MDHDDQDADASAEESSVVTHADGSVTYRLAFPRTSEGDALETVTLRRCNPSDLMAAEAASGNTARNIMLISRLGNIPAATVKRLDGYDYMALNEIASGFLQKRPETGAKPSSPSATSRTSPSAS